MDHPKDHFLFGLGLPGYVLISLLTCPPILGPLATCQVLAHLLEMAGAAHQAGWTSTLMLSPSLEGQPGQRPLFLGEKVVLC